MKPVTVKRDELGFWTHPDWDESNTLENAREWFAKYDLTCDLVIMEGDIGDLWAAGEINTCKDWDPEIPSNAFLVGIWDTEDGVVAMYAEAICGGE